MHPDATHQALATAPGSNQQRAVALPVQCAPDCGPQVEPLVLQADAL